MTPISRSAPTARKTSRERPDADDDEDAERRSFSRVEDFLDGIERDRSAARTTRWVGLAVGATIGGVALLTAIGLVPVSAENLILSASAVVAGLTLGKAS
jgi:hypothetical protein